MARSINKVFLLGHIGKDPESHKGADGKTLVTKISLATNYSVKNEKTGQYEDKTEWHRVVFFGKLAEIAEQYLRKGSQIHVEGRLQTQKWQDKNGVERYTTEIIASEMVMLGGRGGGDNQPMSTTNNTQLPDQFDKHDDVPF